MNMFRLKNVMATAGFSAVMLFSLAANAAEDAVPVDFPYVETAMPAIQSGYPSTMADWLDKPGQYSWNPANVREGQHPDRPDGVVYIFPDAATAETWDGVGIPEDAVAYIHWALDNGSGLFPGIMAISDDPDFKKQNCIMASGDTIPFDVDKLGEPLPATDKKCGNGQGTSKRFKLVILQADQPIDLIFNTTNTTFINADAVHLEAGESTDLVYDYFYDPAQSDLTPCPDLTNPQCFDVTDDIFRNYRYIMKVGNGTGTDVGPDGARVDLGRGTRLAGIKVELGSVDDTGSIIPINGLTYELTECIPDPYFDVPPPGSAPKGTCVTGEVQVWLEEEYATISPAMYAVVGDDRNPEGGYWDKEPAGIYPPAMQTANVIDSGVVYDATVEKTGAITSNYFNVGKYSREPLVDLLPDRIMFGYLMYYGIFEEGDPGLIPMGIYQDDDGDPATEGGLFAWWDGTSPTCCYRWGIDKDDNGLIGPDPWGTLSDAELAYIAARELENTTELPPHYEIAYADDLGGLNMDTYIKITPDYDVAANPTFTVRLTGQSIAAANVADGAPGTADGPWVATPAMEFADFPEVTDPVDPDPDPDPVDPVDNKDDDDGLFGLSWIVVGLFSLGLLLRRKRF